MVNIGLIVSYDGTDYNGYQSQSCGNTIQDKLEAAVCMLTGERVKMVGSGRTDAGVHARNQFVNFETTSNIPIDRWERAMNARLPKDIVVQAAFAVPALFHARRKAYSKTYRYSINCNRNPDLFRRRYEAHHPTPLDFSAMRESLNHLLGEHDFSAFTAPQSTKTSHIRTIMDVRLEIEDQRLVEVESPYAAELEAWDLSRYPGKQRGIMHLYITGSGFLYHMVRIIAGTLIQVGEGKRSATDLVDILASKSRARAGPTAVPHGLCLWEVSYSHEQLKV